MRPGQRVPSLPAVLLLPGKQVRKNTRQQTVRICRAPTTVGPSAGARPARGRNGHSYPRLAGLANNDGLRPSHLWRHNQNNPLTTTPRRSSGCSNTYISHGASRDRVSSTAQARKRLCFRRGFGLAGLAVGVRSFQGGLLGLSFGARGCAGEIISSETQPSPSWVLSRFRIWEGWDKCRT